MSNLVSSKSFYYGSQNVNKEDAQMVYEATLSSIISQGPILKEFESTMAQYCGSTHCLAVNNGTSALHLAHLALGVNSTSIVWTTALSFVATSNSARYCNARVKFIDIDRDTLNIDIDRIEAELESAKSSESLPDVITVVHFAGEPVDMHKLHQLSIKYSFKIIEDACHALGAEYHHKKIGACQYSDITSFSLHPVKSMTTGEGGLITTNNEDLFKHMHSMRAHGMSNAKREDEPWRVEIYQHAFNFKISDINCALGLSQSKRLEDFVQKRNNLEYIYRNQLNNSIFKFQKVSKDNRSASHIMPIAIDFSQTLITKLEFFHAMKKLGIHLSLHYLPIPAQPLYKELGYLEADYPKAMEYYDETFSFPLHFNLSEEDISFICETTKKLLIG